VICLIIGVFPAVIWISLAFASIYMVVDSSIKKEIPAA
jgi:hypothetical protein